MPEQPPQSPPPFGPEALPPSSPLPPCLDRAVGKATLGTMCEGCVPDCDRLALGEWALGLAMGNEVLLGSNARLLGENEDLRDKLSYQTERLTAAESEILGLIGRVSDLRFDALVESALTPAGLKDLLKYDENMAYELIHGDTAAVLIDIRFLSTVNKLGYLHGSSFIHTAGSELGEVAEQSVRLDYRRDADRPYPELKPFGLEKLDYASDKDILIRLGGDEFVALVRNVTPAQADIVNARINGRFSVSQGLVRYAGGSLPIIGSVGHAHNSQIEAPADGTTGERAYEVFDQLCAKADEGHRAMKDAQYGEMWRLARAIMPHPPRQLEVAENHSYIAQMFLRYCCPSFADDPAAFLDGQE